MVSSSGRGGRGRRLYGRIGCRRGERFGDVLERLALGVDAEEDLDETAGDHDPGADEIADEQTGLARAVPDERAVESRPEGTDDLGDREEDRDRLGANLDRPRLAHR